MEDDLNFIQKQKSSMSFQLEDHLSLLLALASPELGTAQPQLVQVVS